MNLTGKIAVITGGARGLGLALSTSLKAKGADVVICDFDETTLEKSATEIGVTGFVADVSDERQVLDLSQKTLEKFGRIDLWINNAGVWMPRQDLVDVDLQKAHKLFETNVFGTIYGMRAALLQMKAQKAGTILNIISTTAFEGMNGSSSSMYVGAKFALRGLTGAVRDELKNSDGADEIKIMAAYPGGIKTEIFKDKEPSNLDQFMDADYVAERILQNLESENPRDDIVIKRIERGEPASLEDFRREINRLDAQIVSLIAERQALMPLVGKYKKKNKLPIDHPEREREILESLAALARKSDANPELIQKIFAEIFVDAKKIQEATNL